MKIVFRILLLVMLITMFYCTATDSVDESLKNSYPKAVTIKLENSTDMERLDEAIVFDVAKLKERVPIFNPNAFVITSDGKELPSQANDLDGDNSPDQIVSVMDFKPMETKRINIRFAINGGIKRDYTKRTQAELSVKVGGKFINRKYIGGAFQNINYLRVPPEHTDHSFYIRYEGPGWESDKVGYRFYLDWRNASDIYGKKVPDMVLQDVGQDGFESYHEMSDWGMDVLKVGESLGIGSIGMWHNDRAQRVSQTDSVTCKIVLNDVVESLIRTKYYGWVVDNKHYDLKSELSIFAGSRMTKHDLHIEGKPDNLCTGIVKNADAEYIQSENNEGWAYIASYGAQSLAEDNLGMAILFHQNNLIEITEDEYNHVVVLNPRDNDLCYYFLGAWEKEPDGIKTKKAFIDYLEETIQKLNDPIKINY